MTRGRAFFIDEDGKVYALTEFNGDMYFEGGYGDEFLIGLHACNNLEEFKKFVKDFNDTHHKYDEKELVYKPEDIIDSENEECRIIDFTNHYGRFFEDYIFFKNNSSKPLHCKAGEVKWGNGEDYVPSKITKAECNVVLEKGQSQAFNYGQIIYDSSIKSKLV